MQWRTEKHINQCKVFMLLYILQLLCYNITIFQVTIYSMFSIYIHTSYNSFNFLLPTQTWNAAPRNVARYEHAAPWEKSSLSLTVTQGATDHRHHPH